MHFTYVEVLFLSTGCNYNAGPTCLLGTHVKFVHDDSDILREQADEVDHIEWLLTEQLLIRSEGEPR